MAEHGLFKQRNVTFWKAFFEKLSYAFKSLKLYLGKFRALTPRVQRLLLLCWLIFSWWNYNLWFGAKRDGTLFCFASFSGWLGILVANRFLFAVHKLWHDFLVWLHWFAIYTHMLILEAALLPLREVKCLHYFGVLVCAKLLKPIKVLLILRKGLSQGGHWVASFTFLLLNKLDRCASHIVMDVACRVLLSCLFIGLL